MTPPPVDSSGSPETDMSRGGDAPGADRGADDGPGPSQATRLALTVGLFISIALSSALVISGAKAGITPGVSPLVVLFGWVVFGVKMGPRLKRFLAISQVTGSAGAAVTAGVVFTAPILQVLAREAGLDVPPVDWPLLIVASIAGALLGFGFVGLATQRFLTDPRLPAPEAVACDRLIETAVANPDKRPKLGRSLIVGLLGGFGVTLASQLHWLREEVYALSIPLGNLFGTPVGVPADAEAPMGAGLAGGAAAATETAGAHLALPLPLSPIYLGIGALLTLPTAILIFAGGLVNSGSVGYAQVHAMPDTTFRWVGGAAMTVAVIYSLVAYALEGRRQRAGAELKGQAFSDELAAAIENTALLEMSPGIRRLLYASLAAGAALLLVMMLMVGASLLQLIVIGVVAFLLMWLLSGLGALLSLQVGSSSSPVSGTVFMGMLVLSLTALGVGMSGMQGVVFLVPIVVAACVAICAANDSSQDYKTMQLNGLRVTDGFKGQLLGLMGGAVAVPLTLWVAHDAYGLGTPELPVPQASFFATVLNSLFLDRQIPWGPVGAGAVLGFIAVGLEMYGKHRGAILSSLAFAVGIYLPSVVGTGILLGALARFLATRRVRASTHEGILVAAGLITGDAFAALLFGILIIAGVTTDAWMPVTAEAAAEATAAGEPIVGVVLEGLTAAALTHRLELIGGVLLLGMFTAILLNYRARRRAA